MSNVADSRSVSTDALEHLGTIITDKEKRDAIHLAVFPIQAGEGLYPGAHIYRDEDDGLAYMATEDNPGIGIVDPFLTQLVKQEEWIYLVVYPRQITSLRHVWEHPAFPPSGETEGFVVEDVRPTLDEVKAKLNAELWLRNCINAMDTPGFDAVMEVLTTGSWTGSDGWGGSVYGEWDGEYIHFTGVDASGHIPSEFWDHLEVYTGHTFSHANRPTYFSCAC